LTPGATPRPSGRDVEVTAWHESVDAAVPAREKVMFIDPTIPVVAIFGSNSTTPPRVKAAELDAAELLASAIRRAGALLLSGAGPGPDEYDKKPDTIKDVSAYTLQNSGDGESAAWIGVANAREARAPRDHRSSGVVVTPGWLHRRNFVEACLCDAAIAIGGTSPGTASEALFCRFLRRRLTVVVNGPPGEDLTAGELQARIGHRVDAEGDRLAVDVGIKAAYRWAGITHKRVRIRSLPTDGATADRVVARLLRNFSLHQPRPDFETLVDEPAWDRYVREALQFADRWPAAG
jgi:predicted Rossmann-fold nucleotide-binding protein